MITSSSNQQMKRIVQLNKKAKARYKQRVFVAEGLKLCMEAPKEDIQAMYVSESFLSVDDRKNLLKEYDYEVVKDSVFKGISDTKTPQGIICVVKMMEYRLSDLIPESGAHLLILEGIQDPGNLGTMIRSGEGAGVTGIIMDQETVDIFNPKVIRAAMGSLYRVPFYITSDLTQTVRDLKDRKIRLYAAHLKGTTMYDRPSYHLPTGFLVGNEGNGLSSEIAGMADEYIRIPMEGSVESLNASVAATLLMYEVNRQRRGCNGPDLLR